MASIRLFRRKPKPAYWLHICGGCLISLKHILSTAQCVKILDGNFDRRLKNVAAYVGNPNLEDSSERYFILDFCWHKRYNNNDLPDTAIYDIGIVLVSL